MNFGLLLSLCAWSVASWDEANSPLLAVAGQLGIIRALDVVRYRANMAHIRQSSPDFGRANVAHIRQSSPDSGLGFPDSGLGLWVKVHTLIRYCALTRDFSACSVRGR